MAPYRSTLFTACVAFFALLQTNQAQNSTGNVTGPVIDVFFIQDEYYGSVSLADQQLAGSIAEANPSSTVVAIECVGDNIDTSVCGDRPMTVTYGPRTFVVAESTGNIGATASCSLAESTRSAFCTAILVAPVQVFTDALTESLELSELITATGLTLSTTSISGTVMPSDMTVYSVTVTAGQELLASASAQAAAGGNGGTKLGPVFSRFVAGILSLTMLLL